MPAVAPAAIASRYPRMSPTTGQWRPKCKPAPIAAPITSPFKNPIPSRRSTGRSCARPEGPAIRFAALNVGCLENGKTKGEGSDSDVGDRDHFADAALDPEHHDDVER